MITFILREIINSNNKFEKYLKMGNQMTNNQQKNSKQDQPKKKPPQPPPRVGKKKKNKGVQAAAKLPTGIFK